MPLLYGGVEGHVLLDRLGRQKCDRLPQLLQVHFRRVCNNQVRITKHLISSATSGEKEAGLPASR
jgi:hypothetical protein